MASAHLKNIRDIIHERKLELQEQKEKEPYDPAKAQTDSLKEFEKSQAYLKSKYESAKSTGKEIVEYGKEVVGLSDRERLNNLSKEIAGSIISDVKSGYRKIGAKVALDKAKKDFGFQQLVSIEDGMKNTIDWYKENKWL